MTSKRVLRVLVVEDQRTLAEALVRTVGLEPDLEPIGSASSGEEALRILALERADAAIIDVGLPDTDGIELCRRLQQLAPGVRVILFTADPHPELARRAIDAGARALLCKSMSLDTLLSAVKGDGDMFAVDPALLVAARPSTFLSPREGEILGLMAEGYDARRIAGHLHLSVHTTRGYIKSLYRKLDVHNQLEAVAAGSRRGLVAGGLRSA
ncbi:response regulator transcription factor [Nocardia sp. N13]|uniref:response regulator transcription factor n=1 Tax=Nocardioides sp. N13(2025) TaxID=3453405 RepID=UPI003F7711A3